MRQIYQVAHRLLLQLEALVPSSIFYRYPALGLLLEHLIQQSVQREIAVFQVFGNAGGFVFVHHFLQR